MEPARHGSVAYSVYCWLLFGIILLVFGLVIVVWPGTIAQRRWLARNGARLLLRSARLPLRVEGLERLPENPHILVANHSSFLDALILSAVLPHSPGYAFVARQEFRGQVLLWPVLRAVGTVILHKHTVHTPSSIERLAMVLEKGENLVIFPEGGIERTPGLRPFHSGAFVVAARYGLPVVLVGIRGARHALPLKTWRPVRTPVTVIIGTVIHPEALGKDIPDNIAQAARIATASLAGEDLMPASCCET